MPAQQIRQVPVGSPAVRASILDAEKRKRNLELARRQQQIEEQQRIANRTPEEKAIAELQSLPSPTGLLRDEYGGTVVSFSEDTLGLAKAAGISPALAWQLQRAGVLKISGSNVTYKGIPISSASVAEAEAQRILAARGQTGTTDYFTGDIKTGVFTTSSGQQYQVQEGGGVAQVLPVERGGYIIEKPVEGVIVTDTTAGSITTKFKQGEITSQVSTIPPEYVRARTEPFNLFSIRSYKNMFMDIREYTKTTSKSAGILTAQYLAGAGTYVVGTVEFGKSLVTQSPIKSAKDIYSGFKETYYYVKSGEALRTIKAEPAFVAGYLTIPIIGLKPAISKIKYKVQDIYYTKGMTKIPASKVVAPEVLRFYEGKGGTRFPYDKPNTFKGWFESQNVKKYGLPNIPKQVKGKPLGYSATPAGSIIEKTGIGEAGQFYSGKGVSVGFLRIGKKAGKLGQDFRTGNKPYVYALYGEGTKVVSKAYEIKVPNPYDVAGKPIKKYIFPGVDKKAGTFYIPTNKPEVQAVVYGKITPIRKEYYFTLGGRRVPIGEYVSAGGEVGKDLISKGVKPEPSSSSILPSKLKSVSPLSKFSISSAIVGYPPSQVVSYTPSIQYSKSAPSVSFVTSYTPQVSIYKSNIPSTTFISAPSTPKEPSKPISYISPVQYKSSLILPPITKEKNLFIEGKDYKTYRELPSQKISRSLYSVEVRRFGKFKNIGVFGSLAQALKVGKQKVGTTLAATLRVRGGEVGTPAGFYKKYTKGGTLLIEQPKFRLSTGTEKMEIKSYRRKKQKGGRII